MPGSDQEWDWKVRYLHRVPHRRIKTLLVHKRIVPMVRALVLILDAHGARLGQNVDDWGWANRAVRGSALPSFHRWGLAIDLDATENLLGSAKTTFARRSTRRAAKLLGFEWGLDFAGRKDPMHFQFVGSWVRAGWLRRRLRTKNRRTRELARLANMPVAEFIRRVNREGEDIL